MVRDCLLPVRFWNKPLPHCFILRTLYEQCLPALAVSSLGLPNETKQMQCPSKWSEILSIIRSFAPKPIQSQALRYTRVKDSEHIIFQVLQNGPRYCPLQAVWHQNHPKPKLRDTHATLSPAHVIFHVLQNGPRYCPL